MPHSGGWMTWTSRRSCRELIHEHTPRQEMPLFVNEVFLLDLLVLQIHMFFYPELAEAQQVENSRGFSLLQFGFDVEELGGNPYLGLAKPRLKIAESVRHEEAFLMSEVQQYHLHEIVRGCQNAGHAASAQDRPFQPVVAAANLGVLLIQIAQVRCVGLEYSSCSAHGPSSRVAVQFSCLICDGRSGKLRSYVKMPEMAEKFRSV